MEKNKIEKRALEILKDFPIIKNMPAMISGRFHIGETALKHAENVVIIMKHLCDEFKIKKEDRDMLIATAYLHDIGQCVITKKGKVNDVGWKYYKETGYSRIHSLARIHPIISASIIEDYHIPRKEEIKRLVLVHMSYWYRMTPKPKNRYEDLICIADYLASRDTKKYE